MDHAFPSLPAFLDEPAGSPIAEVVLRVVVEREGWKFDVVGTATLIAGHLAVTARHVIEHILQTFGAPPPSEKGVEIDSYNIRLYQVLPGPIYRVWEVHSLWFCPSDIAVLHLGLSKSTEDDEAIEWKQPHIRALPPAVGERVVAFGYRASEIAVRETSDGVHHVELNDRPTTSIGLVRAVYPQGRDRSLLPFPCFEIEARFDGGMSGGLVVDEAGRLCGLVCASPATQDDDLPPVSYAVCLWPMLTTMISANRGPQYPLGVPYPMIDLALDRILAVSDLADLDPMHFPGRTLPAR